MKTIEEIADVILDSAIGTSTVFITTLDETLEVVGSFEEPSEAINMVKDHIDAVLSNEIAGIQAELRTEYEFRTLLEISAD